MSLLFLPLILMGIHMFCVTESTLTQGTHCSVMKKLETFWRICILPEMLGRWYTRRCDLYESKLDDNAICFCRGQLKDHILSCTNVNCPYGQFHTKCLSLDNVIMPKQWYCPHCCKLPQFKKGQRAKLHHLK